MIGFSIEFDAKLTDGSGIPLETHRCAQQQPAELNFSVRIVALHSKESGGAAVGAKQAAEAFGCFDLGIRVGRMFDWHDQLVT